MAIRRPGGILEESLTHSIIGGFYRVHKVLGFGFLESVYLAALEVELIKRGHKVAREVRVAIAYEEVLIAHQRIDMIVDAKVILEVKSSERLHPHGCRQLLNYLRAT